MNEEKIIKEEAEQLLDQIGIKADVKLEKLEEGYNVFIDSPDNALLIGKHGNTLSSLETILSLIINQKLGEFRRIVVEIGGYRKEREEYLTSLADRLKEAVVTTGDEKVVRGLKAWERRLIHIHLQTDENVTTESTGEGQDRILVIKKK